MKLTIMKKSHANEKISSSYQNKLTCDADYVNIVSRLSDQVFYLMKPDLISLEAKRDVVIVHVGEHYLNNQKDTHVKHTVINKMRELSCLLIKYRSLVKEKNLSVIDIINPKNFEKVVETIKTIAGFDYKLKTYVCPYLLPSICDSLKLACTVLANLILKDNLVGTMHLNKADWIKEVNIFKNLLETQWKDEFSLSDDDEMIDNVQKKSLLTHIPIHSKEEPSKSIKAQIPYSLLHLAVHLKHFQQEVLKIAFQCQQELFNDSSNEDAYRLLVQSSLALLYTSNMRNFEDTQYIMIKHYLEDEGVNDFDYDLSYVERLLSTKHKRIFFFNEENERVLILIPYFIQCFISEILRYRDKYVEEDNKYIFTIPGSVKKWVESKVAIKNLCQIIKLEEESIGCDKFRQFTAIIMGILNLSREELQQLGHFMGCVLESDNSFFEFPLDAYQIAKFARLLLMMQEEPILAKYKGKCLAEIDIDPNYEYASNNGVKDEIEDIIVDDGQYTSVYNGQFTTIVDRRYLSADENCTNENYQQGLDNMDETCENNQLNENYTTNTKNYQDDISLQNDTSDSSPFETFCDKPARGELQKAATKCGNKRGWTNYEIELIEKEYSFFIESGAYPSGKQMHNFLLEYNMSKTVPVLRSKIQHLIRVKKKSC